MQTYSSVVAGPFSRMAAAATASLTAATAVTPLRPAPQLRPADHQARMMHQLSSQQWAFLSSWHQVVQPKLTQLLTILGTQEVARNLALVQIWTYLPVLLEGRQQLKAEQLCLLGSPHLRTFHSSCCEEGVAVHLLGPMGKAWENGVVKVVQSLDDLSRETHPCNRLQGGLEKQVAEVVYIPVFDCGICASSGVVAVLELFVAAQAHDHGAVADAISCCAHLMDALQLSLSNPVAYHSPTPPASAPAAAIAAVPQQAPCLPMTLASAPAPLAPSAPPTAPSSPSCVPTPQGSPAAASPFAALGGSPFASPTKALQRSAEALAALLRGAPAGAPRSASTSAPSSFVALPPQAPAARAPSMPPAWPGAGWVAPAPGAGFDLQRAASDRTMRGGMGRRSLSRTASFRKDLHLNETLVSDGVG